MVVALFPLAFPALYGLPFRQITWLLHDFYTKHEISQDNFPFLSVLWIRIRMFLGLPDPDPLVRGTNPDPSRSRKQHGIRNDFGRQDPEPDLGGQQWPTKTEIEKKIHVFEVSDVLFWGQKASPRPAWRPMDKFDANLILKIWFLFQR
jgi:hypothetical protein